LWEAGLSLRNIGEFCHTTVGGFISGCASGGSHKYGSYDAVVGIRFVNGVGELHTLWRNDTNPDDFYALGVSFGMAGVIYEVILKPEPAFCVEIIPQAEYFGNAIIPSVSPEKIHSVLTSIDYARVWANIFPRFSKDLLFIGNFAKVVDCEANQEARVYRWMTFPQRVNFIHVLDFTFTNNNSYHRVEDILGSDYGKLISDEQSISEVQLCWKKLREDYDRDSLTDLSRNSKFGPSKEVIEACMGGILDDAVAQKSSVHRGYEVIAWDQNTVNFGIVLEEEHCEMYFRLENNDPIKVISALLDYLKEKKFDSMGHVGGPELYMLPASEFFMHPCYQSACIRIAMFYYIHHPLFTMEEYFHSYFVFFAARGFNITLHWGKYLPLTPSNDAKHLEPNFMRSMIQNYPNARKWMQFIRKHDPKSVFQTEYWTKLIQLLSILS
jgi:hypothetical protein